VTEAVQAAVIRRRIRIPLRFADGYSTTATVVSFVGLTDAQQHVALELGRPAAAALPLVRPHSECLTGDVFGSQRCDCGPQLREAVERITKHGGYVLYLRQEGRGIGLYDKLDAYALQDRGLDTYDANLALGHQVDERDYTSAAQMLHALSADRIVLLSNNPDKGAQLARLGITIASQVPTALHLTGANAAYLATKAQRGGHDLLSRAPLPAAPRVDPAPAGDVGPATQMEARCVRLARRMKARRMKARCRRVARWIGARFGSRQSWGCSLQPLCSASCPSQPASTSLAGSWGWLAAGGRRRRSSSPACGATSRRYSRRTGSP
jgi:GTP cyclohydrolase II